jgi:cobalt-zinc-cadmium efflux system protein
MSNDDVSCTMHVVLREGADVGETRSAVQAMLRSQYEIEYSTIQTEGSDQPCEDDEHLHR